jgi:alkylhydroperoxidase family enzyme
MPRIEPVPWEEVSAEVRALFEEGMEEGFYPTPRGLPRPVPLQIYAYSSGAAKRMHYDYLNRLRDGLLEPRLEELVRIRSAQLGGCMPCANAIKDGSSVDEDDVACLVEFDMSGFTDRERAAMRFLEYLINSPDRIDDEFYRELAGLFTTAEIVELGLQCSGFGIHRFLSTLNVYGEEEPAIPYEPSQIDARTPIGVDVVEVR